MATVFVFAAPVSAFVATVNTSVEVVVPLMAVDTFFCSTSFFVNSVVYLCSYAIEFCNSLLYPTIFALLAAYSSVPFFNVKSLACSTSIDPPNAACNCFSVSILSLRPLIASSLTVNAFFCASIVSVILFPALITLPSRTLYDPLTSLFELVKLLFASITFFCVLLFIFWCVRNF